MNIKECYRILGITPDASLYEIKEAYRDLVKVWHPDKYENNPRLRDKAEKQLKQINMAYDTLLFQLFSEREQASKEREHKEQEKIQPQEQGRAKQKGKGSGQRESITERGSLTVLKCSSRFLWWCR
jgi:curved DNA-binding protein CbpA